MQITDHDEVCRVLADPAFVVPHVPPVEAPVGIAWLRAHVSRFSTGAEHARRRGLVVEALARLDPAELRRAARERATDALGTSARLQDVPIETLAAALGVAGGVAADVAVAGAAYQPHAKADADAADAAVQRLVEACGGETGEAAVVRVCLLVQAAGTAVLTASAAERDDRSSPVDDLLAETLRSAAPVPATRRVASEPGCIGVARVNAGTVVALDLTAGGAGDLQFGAGLRPCPGRAHALALVAGALEGARAHS